MPATLDRLEWPDIAVRLGAAAALAAVVGFEREMRSRPAGLRTMMLVGLGSAAFVVAGHEMVVAATDQEGAAPATLGELGRVLQGVIGGVGFLGAGAVIQSGKTVKGLTTAASVWVTAAVGVACGLGFYQLAAITTLVAIFTLTVLGLVEKRAIDPARGGDDADPDDDRPGQTDRTSGRPERESLRPGD